MDNLQKNFKFNFISKECFVKFYDSDQANIDRDYSGKNEKYYPMGKVIKVYTRDRGDYLDKLCDIQVGDRISKGHFVDCVEIVFHNN